MPPKTLKIAVKTPLYRVFDYLGPDPNSDANYLPGTRVRVPFGRRRVVGVIWEGLSDATVDVAKLRRIERVIDAEPLLDEQVMALLRFASTYYQHAPGEVVAAALPRALRDGEALWPAKTIWTATAALDADALATLKTRAPAQFAAATAVLEGRLPAHANLDANMRRALSALTAKALLHRDAATERPPPAPPVTLAAGPTLNPEQRAAIARISADPAGFAATLLDGVTGSGKTEVYLQAIATTLAQGRDVLVLVPEIGLTPQLLSRFEARFGFLPAAFHSGLTDAERLTNYRRAAAGSARIVIGTRSAVFCPLPALGLIVVDEEHDTSLKQQEGFRYSARDLAIARARQADVPIVLGSATPSLESLRNARSDRYQYAELTERAGGAQPPTLKLIDTSVVGTTEGLSGPLREAIERHLTAGGQVLLHINRRGFAPTVVCADCGHICECDRCDARLTLHAAEQRLWCHHCDADRALPPTCPVCNGTLRALGSGSERIETALNQFFPGEHIVRIDSDSTRKRGALAAALEQATNGSARILVGTQMLAKGHHFPALTLVGILNSDQGLFGSEFRAAERLAQSLVQVAGRAGREDARGEVLIQTDFPNHPLLALVLQQGYQGFADFALNEREAAGWPPYAHLALLRAQSTQRADAWAFLSAARASAERLGAVTVYGPVKALMERRAGRYRAQLLLHATSRAILHPALRTLRTELDEIGQRQRVRWALDVDPVDLA